MKVEALKDGTTVVLREPTMEDAERMLRFFKGLPEEDRRYLRVDVTKKAIVKRRIRQAEDATVHRIVALVEDDIIGDAALEFSGDRWTSHMGEIRVIVGRDYQAQRLGTMLIGEMFVEAQRREIEKVIVKMATPQIAVRKICDRLGFHVDAVLPEHIKDAEGNLQDLVVMSYPLDAVSTEMKDFYRKDDWPDG